MSFDGLFTKAMVAELSQTLKGGRINKVHQPYKNEIILVIRANGKNHKLLLSVHPSYARVQLTNESHENPSVPPMFCMLLRKHLEGYILESIHQEELDRIIIFEVKGRNEIGDTTYKKLIVEIMGRHSNITLVDQSRNIILDSIKHVSYAVNSYRAILPGQEYILPPKQNKANPFTADETDILRKLDFNSGKIDKQLVANFAGISPLFAKEVLFHAGLANQKTIPAAFLQQIELARKNEATPAVTASEGKEYFYLFPLKHIGEDIRPFATLSEMLDRFYFGKAVRDRVKQQANDLERFIMNEKEKNEKKIKKLEATLKEAENADIHQLYGELITANIYAIQKGMKEVEVINYYDEDGGTVVIPLNPQKTPSENAQKYFTRYQKAKNAKLIVKEQMEKASEEVIYFDSLLQQVLTASTKDIAEIREELVEGGYLRERQKKQAKKSQNHKPVLDYFYASDGTEIIVGKNNKQNDYLTNKLAARDEIWLHTKDIPGSHVVIKHKVPNNETILEAASLAAYYSKARSASKVPVDYTLVRHVKKPNGAKPGFVIYDNQQTVYVTPDEELVLKLAKS
ncbi:NFACT RNA binding domain-containing protein [Cytobacillus horneckiae]|uniref:Rqc2 family fibronectin-binding protein n=1 Tax=Cytobacillus horneckiae TaxID=549687 RepID=UPI00203FFABB|nr:NFACT RNA binding domain-containing protein [Cytobacillus horneckiae]MCM3178312.1 NFACT RNA binding domain-containing protein [Cytobacillus horneckiae]